LLEKKRVISEELAGECVLYDGVRKKAHSLNPTLTWIWRRCDGQASIEEMADAFEQQFHVENGLEVVLSGLRLMQSYDLLEDLEDMRNLLDANELGMNRRTVIAAGSALLPAMISVMAPTAAAAKSKPEKIKDKTK
jgi:hypothetical protein